MLLSGVFQFRRRYSATTVYRALPVCGWPALGMSWGAARSNAASALCTSCEAPGTGGCGSAEQVVCGGCRFAAEWRICRGGGSTRQPQRTEPCQCVSSQSWACHGALQGQIQSLQCAAGVEEPALGAAAGWAGHFKGWCSFAECWSFPDVEARLGNHSAQSPASV